jgi:hypothetical protein
VRVDQALETVDETVRPVPGRVRGHKQHQLQSIFGSRPKAGTFGFRVDAQLRLNDEIIDAALRAIVLFSRSRCCSLRSMEFVGSDLCFRLDAAVQFSGLPPLDVGIHQLPKAVRSNEGLGTGFSMITWAEVIERVLRLERVESFDVNEPDLQLARMHRS